MNLKYITCSDPRESVDIKDVITLLNLSPKVEIGMQSHPSAMTYGMNRNIWFNKFLAWAELQTVPVNVAMHVNYQWCDALCSGKIPTEIARWMDMRNKKTDTPLIKRWQLNIGDGTRNFDPDQVAKLIERFPENDFILPYNDTVSTKIQRLYQTRAKFSLLYDSSYGYGVCPDKWNVPVYNDIPMGYAGGLSADNVSGNLDKIAKVVPCDYTTWIDAEGRMMQPGTRTWDMANVCSYVKNALEWELKSQQKTK